MATWQCPCYVAGSTRTGALCGCTLRKHMAWVQCQGRARQSECFLQDSRRFALMPLPCSPPSSIVTNTGPLGESFRRTTHSTTFQRRAKFRARGARGERGGSSRMFEHGKPMAHHGAKKHGNHDGNQHGGSYISDPISKWRTPAAKNENFEPNGHLSKNSIA